MFGYEFSGKKEIQDIQADLVLLEGMLEMVKQSAYRDTNPALIGNSLEIMLEFLSNRTERMDRIVQGMISEKANYPHQ